MAKKTTLQSLAARLEKGFASVNGRMDQLESVIEKGFTAVAGDIADLRTELKGDIARVQEQVSSIEAELKYGRYETRPGKLEDKVFGSTTASLFPTSNNSSAASASARAAIQSRGAQTPRRRSLWQARNLA